MINGKKIQVAILGLGLTAISIVYLINKEEMEKLRFPPQSISSSSLHDGTEVEDGYLVSTPNCKLIKMDPWDKSISKYMESIRPIVCSKIPLLTYTEVRKNAGNVLKIDEGVVGKYKSNSYHRIECCFSVISRISQNISHYTSTADDLYKVSDCKTFKKEAVLTNTTEFLLVRCQSIPKNRKRGKEVYKNVHAVVPILPKVMSKIQKLQKDRSMFEPESLKRNRLYAEEEPLKRMNVLIIGIDSVSRSNLRRTMPKTLEYLKTNEWVELNGYNKIADNTFPNLMAILSGQNFEQVRSQCNRVMDHCPYIWKDYNEKGYVTAYAEDSPYIGTFRYLKVGFVEQPTDYYLRPLVLSALKLLPYTKMDNLPICVGPVSEVDRVLNYAKSFAQTFNNYNYFGLFWMNSFSHNNANLPRALDFRLTNFLKDLARSGTYENATVILLSDHGTRFGGFRNTFVGYYEERLPFIFISVPKWFRHRHPIMYKNLLINKNRLTTPYDLHVTLKRLLDEDYAETQTNAPVSKACPKCVSLFQEVPLNRSCADASIEPHWCMCYGFRKVEKSDPFVAQTAQFFFDYIINRTRDLMKKENVTKTLCAERTLSKIVRVHQNLTPDNLLNVTYVDTYVVVLQLNPGKALFEATIQVTKNGDDQNPIMKVAGDVSRLDSYRKTSQCVDSAGLLIKYYCHCTR